MCLNFRYNKLGLYRLIFRGGEKMLDSIKNLELFNLRWSKEVRFIFLFYKYILEKNLFI